jgi:hypothetical protein
MTTKTRLILGWLLLSALCLTPLSFAEDRQDNWRWCHKCQSLFFGDVPHSRCPVGGTHDASQSGNYSILYATANIAGQDNWRWCDKCQGLFFAGAGTACPAGGSHNQGTTPYRLLESPVPGLNTQSGWHWCKRCGSLFFGNGEGSRCPVHVVPSSGTGGVQTLPHDGGASGDYHLILAKPPAVASIKNSLSVTERDSIALTSGEAQSTVVPPGKKAACGAGRILVSTDLKHPPDGLVVGRDLDNPTVVTASTFNEVPNKADYKFGTN